MRTTILPPVVQGVLCSLSHGSRLFGAFTTMQCQTLMVVFALCLCHIVCLQLHMILAWEGGGSFRTSKEATQPSCPKCSGIHSHKSKGDGLHPSGPQVWPFFRHFP